MIRTAGVIGADGVRDCSRPARSGCYGGFGFGGGVAQRALSSAIQSAEKMKMWPPARRVRMCLRSLMMVGWGRKAMSEMLEGVDFGVVVVGLVLVVACAGGGGVLSLVGACAVPMLCAGAAIEV